MSEMNASNLADYLYERKIPQVYRDMDSPHYPLKRYIHSLIEGGFSEMVQKCNDLTSLTDPEKCPDSIFPYLFESFGYKYDPSVSTIYYRRILLNHGELVRRRGTVSYIKFLTSTITGLDCSISSTNKVVTVTLYANTLEDVTNMSTNVWVVQKLISDQLPYFITMNEVISEIKVEVIPERRYIGAFIVPSVTYSL